MALDVDFGCHTRDLAEPDKTLVDRMCEEGTRRGFETESVEVASFADQGALVEPGFGIQRLIERTVIARSAPAWFGENG